jgi:hypothetical protein
MGERERLVRIKATESRDAIRRLGAKKLATAADAAWIREYNSVRNQAVACNPDIQGDLPLLEHIGEFGELINPERVISYSQLLAKFSTIAELFGDA